VYGYGYHYTCEACGTEGTSHRWGRKYCSKRCRQAAYRKRCRDAAKRGAEDPQHPPATVTRKCRVCRSPFEATRPNARTCSAACRQKAYRRRLAKARAPRKRRK